MDNDSLKLSASQNALNLVKQISKELFLFLPTLSLGSWHSPL